jgi:phosphate transport system substrate-binding protein
VEFAGSDSALSEDELAGEFLACAPGSKAIDLPVYVSPLVERENPNDLVIDVDRTSTAAGVYPLVLVSYLIACEEYPDADQAELVEAYLAYVASPEGQAAAAESAGSAPLSDEFSDRVLEAVASIR